MDMANRLDDLDKFVVLMKQKIIACSNKHKENEPFGFIYAKNHLIDEICELFDLTLIEKQHIGNILWFKEIKLKELIDVANMCWICNYLGKKLEEF